MSIKAVLFDLDGTLLPMDINVFTKAYFGGLSKRLAPYGYEPEPFVAAIWQGTKKMICNDGKRTNEEVFWDSFIQVFGDKVIADKPVFEAFYQENFDDIRSVCGCDPLARVAVDTIKDRGFRVALATNPFFPAIATEKRMRWAGFEPSDFEFYTTYENSSYCKPNVKYYEAIAKKMGVEPNECLMIGNDATEDMVAEKLGMSVFLITDCLINKDGVDISKYPRGSFSDLIEYIKTL